MTRILVIEDDEEFASTLIERLVVCKYDVEYAADGTEAKLLLLENHYDIVLIDLMLPPTYTAEGIELLRLLRQKHQSTIPLLMTVKNQDVTEIVADAMVSGAAYFFDKNASHFLNQILLKLKELKMATLDSVFVSHGHNDLLKYKLKDFLTNSLKKNVVILSELPNVGMTVVEKLERASDQCNFAIILMTKDDEQRDGATRARQNVIHEIGFFQGKYGRSRVVLLAEQGLELFTNISGIVRIEFDPAHFEGVYEPLRTELSAV